MTKKAKDSFSLEEKLREIRSLLDKMQSGDLDFDENMRLFQEGTTAIKKCRVYLDEAELSVKQLIETNDEAEEIDFE